MMLDARLIAVSYRLEKGVRMMCVLPIHLKRLGLKPYFSAYLNTQFRDPKKTAVCRR